MKKTLFFVFGILFSFLIFSQSYVPIPSSDAVWRESYKDDFHCYTIQNRTFRDTMINSMLYLRIKQFTHQRTIFGDNCIGQPIITKATFFVRNDSANKKVWFRGLGFMDHDSLLYDFNLGEGSTLSSKMHGVDTNSIYTVDNISTKVIGGTSRKFYYLSDNCQNTFQDPVLIEGIGSTYGLFASLDCQATLAYTLECTIENGTTAYPNSDSTCQIILGFNDVINNPILAKVFPNPTDGIIAITHHPSVESIYLFNLRGEKIQEHKTFGKNVSMMRILEKQGVYILQLRLEDGNSTSLKVIRK